MNEALTGKKKEDILPKKEEKRRKSWKRRKKEELDTLDIQTPVSEARFRNILYAVSVYFRKTKTLSDPIDSFIDDQSEPTIVIP